MKIYEYSVNCTLTNKINETQEKSDSKIFNWSAHCLHLNFRNLILSTANFSKINSRKPKIYVVYNYKYSEYSRLLLGVKWKYGFMRGT